MTTTIEELKPMFLRLKLTAMYDHTQEMLDDVETFVRRHLRHQKLVPCPKHR